jgi:hypothetical protein
MVTVQVAYRALRALRRISVSLSEIKWRASVNIICMVGFLADGSVRARSLLTVAGWILNNRAASAARLVALSGMPHTTQWASSLRHIA